MAGRIAVQLYTLREFTQTSAGLAKTLQKLRAIGYDDVEFGGVEAGEGDEALVTAREVRRMLDDAGIRCPSAHRPWESLRDRIAAEIDFLRTLGCSFVAVPSLAGAYDRLDLASYQRFVDESAPVAESLNAEGIRLGYHNHAHEFSRSGPDRKRPFDILAEATGTDLALEIDVYWAAFAGVNPAQLIQRASGRVPVIHMKDMEVDRVGDGSELQHFYAPVGEGNLDWDGIVGAGKAAGVQVWVVEQDLCRRNPFDCVRSSREFLLTRV